MAEKETSLQIINDLVDKKKSTKEEIAFNAQNLVLLLTSKAMTLEEAGKMTYKVKNLLCDDTNCLKENKINAFLVLLKSTGKFEKDFLAEAKKEIKEIIQYIKKYSFK